MAPESTPTPTSKAKKEPVGPIIGAGIVVVLLIIGALYFWGAELNKSSRPQDQLPLITGEPTTEAQQ